MFREKIFSHEFSFEQDLVPGIRLSEAKFFHSIAADTSLYLILLFGSYDR